jgi:hypothetical protein
VLGADPVEPCRLVAAEELGLRSLGERGRVQEEAGANGVFLARAGEALGGELPHGLEISVSRTAGALHHRDEGTPGEKGEEIHGFEIPSVEHGTGRLHVPPADEDGERAERGLLVRLERVHTPVERGSKRRMAA